jgi:crotonobetainyl-CoA:carnitine CoA-transferase CaiB-like acyl-CoA transferase
MGADVVKVEPPGGDGIRRQGPYVDGYSYPFEFLNHNTKSVVIDLKSANGPAVLHKIAADADVFVQNWKPGTADRLQVGYDDLSKTNPRLVYCAISGFGQTGPYGNRGAVDIVAQAMGGLMGVTGEPGRPPVKVSYPMTDVGSSLWAVIGILAALNAREKTGRGQLVDVALLDAPVSWSFWEAAQYFGTGEIPEPLGSSHRNAAPYRAFQCADEAHVAIGVASQSLWERFCPIIEADWLTEDDRFATPDARRTNRSALEEILADVFTKRTRDEWLDLLVPAGIPAGPVYKYDEVVSDPQVVHRGLIGNITLPGNQTLRVPDVPLFLSDTPRLAMQPAPELGADTRRVLTECGCTSDEVDAFVADGTLGADGLERTKP